MTQPAETAEEPAFSNSGPYRTVPPETDRLPPGIPYIVGNEIAERFSFYGMKAILAVFMTEYLLNSAGEKAPMADTEARYWMHTFVVGVYFTPIFGAILSDWLWGKYRTIILLSMVYCLGHLALALDETRLGLALGLSLIAIGSGAVKPCVSAHVGDQFGKRNEGLLGKMFGWFYFSINLGAFVSTVLTPVLLDKFGPHIAFAVPGILMALATFIFWMGRYQFVHVPPRGREFLSELFSAEVLGAFVRMSPIYVCAAAFFCLFDQTSSSWVLQARNMDREVFGITILSSQLQAFNPLFIMAMVPVFEYVLYPAVDRVWRLTSLRKIGLGMFLTIPVFVINALIEESISAGGSPSVGWHVLAYLPLTAAEILVSITLMEFSYTQAPKSMKSVVMSFYLLSVALGNELTAVVNAAIELPNGESRLPGASYYWFFTAVMAVAAVVYVAVAMRYRGKTYGQPTAGSP